MKKTNLYILALLALNWGLYGILCTTRENQGSEILAYIALLASVILILYYEHFNPLVLWTSITIAFSLVYHTFSLKKNNDFDGLSENYFDSLYFSIVTGTTVGYGDIVPKSSGARILSTSQIFISFVFVYYFIVGIKHEICQ
jgi:uncharacterized membrane protein